MFWLKVMYIFRGPQLRAATEKMPRNLVRTSCFRWRMVLASFALTLLACLAAWALGSILAGTSARADDSLRRAHSFRAPKVVVIKHERVLHLFDGAELIKSYPIALGKQPEGAKLYKNDNRTPEGLFRICTRNDRSRYHRFLGISYPDAQAVGRGIELGLISNGQAAAIRDALAEGRRPDWDTALGGAVGLHGGGTDSDWTAGCVALSNADIEEVFGVLSLGDPVEIRP